MPAVKQGESKEQFINRCVPELVREGKERDQAIAVCNTMYQQAQSRTNKIGPIEMLSKLKSFLSKYGYSFDESNLNGIVENIKLKKSFVGLEGDKFHFYNLDSINIDDSLSPTGTEQKILVFPRGTHYIQKLDDWLDFNDLFFNEIAESFDCEALKPPFVDKNHTLTDSYGELVKYSIEPEGMYFFVIFNKVGKELIKDNVYKYHSPSFGPVKDTKGVGHKNALISISLTNIPALMTANPVLQEQTNLNMIGGKMINLAGITKVLNLQDEASPDAIMAAIEELIAAGMEKDAVVAELEKAIEALKGEVAEKTEEVEKTEEELSTYKEAALNDEAEKVIDLAIEAGQYHPATKDLKVEWYKANKDNVLKELELIPKSKNVGQQSATNPEVTNLSQDEKEAADALGLDLSNPETLKIWNQVNKEG